MGAAAPMTRAVPSTGTSACQPGNGVCSCTSRPSSAMAASPSQASTTRGGAGSSVPQPSTLAHGHRPRRAVRRCRAPTSAWASRSTPPAGCARSPRSSSRARRRRGPRARRGPRCRGSSRTGVRRATMHEDQDRPDEVELLLDRERPEVLDRAGCVLGRQVVDRVTREHPVHDVQRRPRGPGVPCWPTAVSGATSRESDQRRGEHQQRGRQQPPDPSAPEGGQVASRRTGAATSGAR